MAESQPHNKNQKLPKSGDVIRGGGMVQIFHMKPSTSSLFPTLMGASEMRVIDKGLLHIIGFPLPDPEHGISLKNFVAEIDKLDAAELKKKACEKPNFEMFGAPGDVLFLPSGCLYLTFSPQGATGVRTSLTPAHAGEDERVFRTAAQVLDMCDSLKKGTWNTWLVYLNALKAAKGA